jgi:hypothetical protein
MDTLKEQLGKISSTMAKIHKAILENEMEERELRLMKPLTPADQLQALLNDPELDWLRSLSRLMTSIDEVYFQKEEIQSQQVATLKKEVSDLMVQPNETLFFKKYRSLLPKLPELMPQHSILRSLLN